MTRAARRILLVRLSHLGDVVHALPVFHALRAAEPGAEIGWVIQREFADLVRGLPGLARVFEFDRRGGVRAWLALRAELARWRADWAIDAQGNWKSAGVVRIAGAARRTGLHADEWRERSAAWLVNDHAEKARGPHAVQRMFALAEHVAGSAHGARSGDAASARELAPPFVQASTGAFELGLGADELERAAQELAQHVALPFDGVIVNLATPGDVRSWPAARFGELARALARRGERVLVLSGPAEAETGRALARELSGERLVAPWTGQRGLRTLAGVFTLAARGGASFAGCDSGPLHLAWACGMRVVCLSGPQDARRTGPWPVADGAGTHAVVRAHAEPACAPCLARRCAHADGPVCMTRIDAGDVLAALERVRSVQQASRALVARGS